MYLKKMLEINGSEEQMYFYLEFLMLRGRLEELKGNFVQSEKYVLQTLEMAIEQGGDGSNKSLLYDAG